MLKFKKVLSALLAVSMLGAGASVAVFADGETETTPSYENMGQFSDYKYHWDTVYGWNSTAKKNITESEETFGCVTDAKANSGSRSYFLKHAAYYAHNSSTNAGNAWVEYGLKQTDLGIPAGTYTLSLSLYGESGVYNASKADDFDYEANQFNRVKFGNQLEININKTTWLQEQTNTTTNAKKGVGTVVVEENGWITYTTTVTLPNECNEFKISSQGHTRAMYIDDISVKDVNGKEYIKNGSFDEKQYMYKTKFDNYAAKWEMVYNGNFDEDEVFGCVTDENVKSGEHGFLLRNTTEVDEKQIVLKQDVNLPVGKTYTVSFDGYGKWGSREAAVRDFDWEGTNRNKVRLYCTKTGGGTEWKEVAIAWDSPKDPNKNENAWNAFTLTFKTSEYSGISGIEAIGFVCGGYTKDLFIDNISVKDETGKEYIINGGFEHKGYEIAPAVFEEVDSNDAVVGDELTAIKAGKIKVSSTVTNLAVKDGVKVHSIVAVYKNGALTDISYSNERTIALCGADMVGTTYSAYVTIPEQDTDQYEIKVFNWDGTQTMVPLKAADCLKKAE